MRIFTGTAFIILSVIFWKCTNIDDATSSKRMNFIRFYEGPLSFIAADMDTTINGDGFVIVGNMAEPGELDSTTVVFETDLFGNKRGEIKYFEGGTGKSIKTTSTGYLILGDSIYEDKESDITADFEIYSARLLILDQNLSLIDKMYVSDTNNSNRFTDIKGEAITVKDDGFVVLLTYEEATLTATVKPWIIALKNDFTLDWEYKFESLTRDYVNGKSIHYYNGSTIWANSLLRQAGDNNEKYVSITKVDDYLSSSNNSFLGEFIDKTFAAKDFQPSRFISNGFGVIGTFSESDGSGKNIFFSRVNLLGSFNSPPDTIFFDGFKGQTSSNLSSVEDTGETLSATSDGGYILAGTTLSAAVDGVNYGKGERDILLVKVNAIGEVVWSKVLGGIGDEVVCSIRETSDKGFIICGTNTVKNYSSIFLIKTDNFGELKN